ncbi:MAG: T9SS type A sorting domain-containing protein [Ignavibacteriae bacterium]|nr:T9SS type A sorting domain-containing protein [Ignavibacteriota bacterium]
MNRNHSAYWILVMCLFATLAVRSDLRASLGGGEDSVLVPLKPDQREIPYDEYVPVSRETLPTSPAFKFSSPSFFAVQVNVNDSGRNIVGDAANEPSIAVDPLNPSRMAIGWRQFNTISSSFRQAGYGYTTDGGFTWRFPGVIEPGVFRSDPVLDSDSDGNFYYNSLTSVGGLFSCQVFKSTNGGATWDTGTYAFGGDKQWMTIDKTGSIGNGNIYAFWTSAFSACPPGSFTRSVDRGFSYQSCLTIPNDPFWGTLTTGPDGELYVFGESSIGFEVVKSTTARDSTMAVLWDTATAVDLDGQISAFSGSGSPNPGGLLGQAWVAVDRSNTPTRGNLYALCSVDRFSNFDPLDVMFARSTDEGLTWSAPVRVNDDTSTTAWQWFGTMSVAPNGRIDVIWLDTRDNPGSVNSSLYYAYSFDGGVTWSSNIRLSNSFNPHLGWPQQNKMGDYFDMVSDDAGAHLAWAGTFNGEQDVYYGRITTPTSVAEGVQAPTDFALFQNYPNPFNPRTKIVYRVGSREFVELGVYDVLGREVATLVNEVKQPGRYEVTWDASSVASGVYLYRLQAGRFFESRRMLLLR